MSFDADYIVSSDKSPFINGEEVTFIYKGEAQTVYLTGDYNRWKAEDKLNRMPNTDL